MKSSVTAAGWFVVCVQALLLVAIALLLSRTNGDTRSIATDLALAHEVNARMVEVKAAVGRVEDALEIYLEHPASTRREYEVAVASSLARLADLRDLASYGSANSDLASIEQTVEQTLAVFASMEALRERDAPGSKAPPADTHTPLYAAYKQIDIALNHQRALVSELQARLDSATALHDRSLLAAGLGALLLQASVVVLLQRDQRRRRILQSTLRSQNEALEALVAERTMSLTQAKEELAWVSQRALQLQERERQYLALELHDQIGQQIAALRMILQHLEAELGKAADRELIAKIHDALELTRTTYGQIHDIAVSLRPAMLDRFGLVPTLEWYARQQAARGPCSIKVLSGTLPAVLPTDLLTAAFRIAQEAVSNALRHGKAKKIDIEVAQVDGRLELTISDDGAGFDLQAMLLSDPSARGFGLLGMRERAMSVGGALTITSRPGEGTTVVAALPLEVGERPTAGPAAEARVPDAARPLMLAG